MRHERIGSDFRVCPHCWHLNGPLSRICLKCRADMTLVLQESGGERWTAAAQSPMPVRGTSRLSRPQWVVLFGFVVLFALAQLVTAFAPVQALPSQPALRTGR